MGSRLDNLPSQLSGGQQQRVAVARALVPRPDIVFADEPTGALDSSTGIEILTFMRRAVDESGQTIVMVTHDPHAASYATTCSSWPTARSSTRCPIPPRTGCSIA